MATTTISIDKVFELLSNADHSLRDKRIVISGPGLPSVGESINTDIITKQDVLQAFLYIQGEYSYDDIFKKALGIIYDSTLKKEEKDAYLESFIDYFSISQDTNNVSTSGNTAVSGFMDRVESISERTSDYFDSISQFNGDVSQIGFYSIVESGTVSDLPSIIPSSISIQEQLLNQPVPIVRSKSVGVIPDHRSKHIVSMDILYPNFESFSNTEKDYPSFVNLLNMFKFMPINSIYSPILSAAFISEYTFPKLFDLVKQTFSEEEFSELSDLKSEDAKIQYIGQQFSSNDLSLSEIKQLFSRDDANLDIGLSAIADNILTRKEIDAGRLEDNFDSENLKDFIINYQEQNGFPVPIGFKSASVQTHADMPGAVIARFSFAIINSPAFPYGSIMYRDKSGRPSYNPSDCYYGKKYVDIASKKILSQSEIDTNNIQKTLKDANLNPISLNDLRLYYFDFQDGAIVFDTANPRYQTPNGPGIILEKVSGSFNTKSTEVPLMGSKFPSIQYLGMNSNACQLIFNVTNKQVIADFMAMKARIVDSEKNHSISNSFAIVENTFINSLGISRITPQSIAIDSDPDIPDLYRLTITFLENYQDVGSKEKLRLEKGITSIANVKNIWKYFYDLYLIWYEENILGNQGSVSEEHSTKLDYLMNALGIRKDYRDIDFNSPSVLNPGRGPHDVYYGPLFMGIIEEYAKKKGATSATGYLQYDFPEILDPRLPKIFDSIGTMEGTLYRDHIEDVIDLVVQGYNYIRGRSREEKKSLWEDPFQSALVKITVNGNPALGEVLNLVISDETIALGGKFVRNFGYTNKNYKNLVDMFHKNNVPISREIWESTFQTILDRKYTKGNDVLVSYTQMDKAFAMLYVLVSSYESSYKFNVFQDSKGDTITELTYSDQLTAKLNISELKRIKEEIESLNKQIINLYPDLYLPTYEDLIRDEPEMQDSYKPYSPVSKTYSNLPSVFEDDSLAKNAKQGFIQQFLKTFAPKYGDTGTIPNFKSFKDLEMDPRDISEMVAVTINHYIDPDIFYFRQRDKTHMHNAINRSAQEKKATAEILKTGKTVRLPVNEREMYTEARRRLVEKDVIANEDYILDSDERLETEISKMLEESISMHYDKSAGNAGDLDALSSFSALGVNQIDAKLSEQIKEYMKSLTTKEIDDTDLENRAEQTQVYHIEYITNDGKIIGDQIAAPGQKYRVLPRVRVGQSPTYYSNVNNMSFSLEDDFEIETDQRALLHTPDLTDSVLKSFPTIRVYFIEEDRDQSYQQDDFYGFGDVIECNITSHIYDNDVCRMKLANFSGVLSTMQFTDFGYITDVKDSKQNSNRKDNKLTAGKKESKNIVDEAGEKFLRKIMLRPGVHIMIKLGYGNNLDSLKTVFTGEIAEVKPGPIVELVAQGYQTELHNEFGGFMEEGFWESGVSVFEDGIDETLKFGFMKIINFILLSNDSQNKRLSKNNMMHLGDPFSVNSYRKGMGGKINPDYEYDAYNSIIQYLGAQTIEEFKAEAQGEMFSWFDSFMEANYFGFSGTNLSRNIYVATSNYSDINVSNEWLITNAPVIDSLREVVRYMPNFICTVVPYEHDATLFIGDPTNVYQYRKANKIEDKYEIKFNGSLSQLRDQDTYRFRNNEINRIISGINKKNILFASQVIQANAIAEKTGDKTRYPKYLAEQIDAVYLPNILADPALMNRWYPSINSSIPGTNQYWENVDGEVIGRILCDILHITYNHDYVKEYLEIAVDLLNVDMRLLYTSESSLNYRTQQLKNPRFKAKAGHYKGLNDFIPLNNYRNAIQNSRASNFSNPYPDYEPKAVQRGGTSIFIGDQYKPFLPEGAGARYFALDYKMYKHLSYFDEGKIESNKKECVKHRRYVNVKVNALVKKHENDRELGPVVLNDKAFGTGRSKKRSAKSRSNLRFWNFLSDYYRDVLRLRQALYFLSQIIEGPEDYLENEVSSYSKKGAAQKSKNILPWNYKVFRDHHVLSSEHDLIANNITASESDMWSAVALRVPMDTIETINGFTWQAFQWGIEEGGVDKKAGTYRVDSDQSFGIYPNKQSGGVNYKGYTPGPKDILENFTEINGTTPSLAQNALKFRLAQGLSKMYRGNLICLGRNIKPYDQVQIVDNVNNIYGKVMAERVIQHFSATTGWTTTIVPCGLTKVNSKQASHNVSQADKWLYTLSQGKLGRYIMNAMTLATFGSAGLGFRGGLHFLGRLPFGFMKRVFQGTFGSSSQGLWAAAKYPYELGKMIASRQNTLFAARAAARFGWSINPLNPGGSGVMLLTSGIKGATDVAYQFNNMSVSQSIALHEGGVVHQPCSISLLTYNGAPFLSGLEDPVHSMSNSEAWAQLSEEFEYAWREWWTGPEKSFKPEDVTNIKILGDFDG